MHSLSEERLSRIERHIHERVGRRVDDLRLQVHDEGLILHGWTRSYHVKQLAQHAVMEVSEVAIRANRIRVAPRIASID